MSYYPGKFTWFEHMSSDPAKAKVFYESLFGWQIKSVDIGGGTAYDMIHNGEQGIGGMYATPTGTPGHWLSYLAVTDADAAYQTALVAGATSVKAPTQLGNVGRGASVIDPTGAVVMLWQSTPGNRDDVERTPAGDWIWNELYTHDTAKSLAFYEGVFGYTHDTMDMGPQGTYYILKSADGKGRGGLMKAPHEGMKAQWTPYVCVEDADKTAAKVAPLGGKLLMGPQDIPGIGRFSVLTDPLGADIAVLRPDPTMS